MTTFAQSQDDHIKRRVLYLVENIHDWFLYGFYSMFGNSKQFRVSQEINQKQKQNRVKAGNMWVRKKLKNAQSTIRATFLVISDSL